MTLKNLIDLAGDIDVAKVKNILKESYSMELTVLTNSEISAQSIDGKQKYSIK